MTITKVKKTERLAKLCRQTEIERDLCSNCPFHYELTLNECVKCPHYKELNKIGDWLLKESANRKGRDIQPTGKPGPAVSDKTMTSDKLSVIGYTNLRSEGVYDTTIAKDLGVSLSSLKHWKVKNGLTKRG